MDLCDRQAALGIDVVPEVNWILTTSLGDRDDEGVGGLASVSCDIEDHGVVARNGVGSIRPLEFSTRMMFLRDGMASEVRVELKRSGTMVSRRGTLDRGGLYGRFVSVPITKCVADRWLKAAMIWVAVNAGLRGVRIAPSLNSAYVIVANSMLFPSDTQTRSPFLIPRLCSPRARTLLSRSS